MGAGNWDAVLFDFDGTVFDTVEGITRSVQYALGKWGIEAELSDLRCFAGPPLVDKFQEVYGFDREKSLETVAFFRERYQPIGLYESRPFPGIGELLAGLQEAGKKTGIATTKPQALAERLLSGSGMLERFDVICGSGVGGDSPKWKLVERAMEALGAARERCVLVGDTNYDAAGAQRCGIDFIGVNYGYAAPGELEQAGTKLFADDMDQLRALLLGGGEKETKD